MVDAVMSKKTKKITVTLVKVIAYPLCRDRWKADNDTVGDNYGNDYSAGVNMKLILDDLGDFKEIIQRHPIKETALAIFKKCQLSYNWKKGDITFFTCHLKSSKYGSAKYSFITGLPEKTYLEKKDTF